MSCDPDQYLATWESYVANLTPNYSSKGDKDNGPSLDFYIYRVAVPTVCAFGILGNILNLVVLLQHQIRRSMDYMEKSAHMGIVALAVSDLLFCTVGFPMAFVPTTDLYVGSKMLFALYYHGYEQPLLNIFMLSSIWLVVVMAVARYLAICWPLHSRGYINLPVTFIAILSVFLLSVLISLPEFWSLDMNKHPCPMDVTCTCYNTAPPTSVFYTNKALKNGYYIIRGIMTTVIPLVVLGFCNINLIRALRQSSKMQRKYRANAPKESSHRITLTLITMVILFFILVCPSTILVFFRNMGVQSGQLQAYQTATGIFNLMLAINFSINFILYCVINVHFRQVIRYILCCMCFRKNTSSGYHPTTSHSLVTQTECLNTEDTEIELHTKSNRKR